MLAAPDATITIVGKRGFPHPSTQNSEEPKIVAVMAKRFVVGSFCDVFGERLEDMPAGIAQFTFMLKPKPLLQVEGAAVLTVVCILYHGLQGRWLWFAIFFLAPDISMLGYLANKRLGAASYNLIHTYTAPLALLGILWFTGRGSSAWLALTWSAHIGFDRMLGYGLKYESAFKDTHLQRT